MNLDDCRPDKNATRVYAVGDVHGRLDLLLRIEAAIRDDLRAEPAEAPLVCYLGDYVDRGPASAGVIDHLAGPTVEGLQRIFLKGNHEDRMLAFLANPEANGPGWIKFGGHETLVSYGLAQAEIDAGNWQVLRDRLAVALPPAHLAFLNALELALRWDGYLFVHAGVDPTRPLSDQDPHDVMWIREPFLSSDRDFGVRVVHGHVIEPRPVFRPNRIGLDTAAYNSGVLTCAVLEGNTVRLLQTG